jgi:Na+-driven multidrug efflux pump
LLPGVVCLVLHHPLFNYISSHGGTRALTKLALVGVAFNVIGNFVVLRSFDYVGAAVISTITYAWLLGGCVVLFCRTTGQPIATVLRAERQDLTDVIRAARSLRPTRT